MLNAFRRFGEFMFKRQTLLEIAKEELYQAEVQRLSLLTAREYAEGMISYRNAQIARLQAYITELESNQSP